MIEAILSIYVMTFIGVSICTLVAYLWYDLVMPKSKVDDTCYDWDDYHKSEDHDEYDEYDL